jgi:trimethylamine corrinoid protein
MSQKEYDALKTAILDGDDIKAANVAEELLKEPSALEGAVAVAIETIRQVGNRFGTGAIFLPEMMLAADAMQAFMKVVGPALEEAGSTARASGKIVLGTVKGDIHTIGKDIAATMLSASGFEVRDMGVDVAPMEMIEGAEQSGAQIIGLSALMTTSMPYQKEVVALLNELNQRDDFFVIVGGGPVTPEYAEDIGANGWARSAAGAVTLCEKLLSSGETPATAAFVGEEK